MNGNTTGILKMTTKYLFDIDGTLTPSRGKINEEFRLFMVDFCEKHECYLVTGSDQKKTIEQIGEYLYNKFDLQFQCSGNQIFASSNKKVHESEWKLPKIARQFLITQKNQSGFPLRTGAHIEDRPGMVNFSVVGRRADQSERLRYVQWDNETDERNIIADRFNKLFPELEATVGGETGLDIAPKGQNKAKVIDWVRELARNPSGDFIFFGDACQEGGNDYPLAARITENNIGVAYNVSDYKETWNILKEI